MAQIGAGRNSWSGRRRVAALAVCRLFTATIRATAPPHTAMTSTALYHWLADLTLFSHTLLVMFVVGGELFILLGWARGWSWTRNRRFRGAHLGCIVIVMLEAWFGITCPLTTLEDTWRARAGEATYAGSFISAWLDRFMFYTAPPWAFTLMYSLFAALVAGTYYGYPPRPRHG